MIRPVLYVNLPGIVRAFDERARARQGDYANFVVAPEIEEPRSGLAALLSAILPVYPDARTWICEDRWRLLGLAQARVRPGHLAWDLAYLAAMTNLTNATLAGSAGTERSDRETQALADDTLMELLQYALNSAMSHGVQRFFVRVEDERPELELFSKLGFQRYARETTYWLNSAAEGLAQSDESARRRAERDGAGQAESETTSASQGWRENKAKSHPTGLPHEGGDAGGVATLLRRGRLSGLLTRESEVIDPGIALRPWREHDAWGLLRLYDACTPRRIQMAEALTSDEFVYTRAGGGRTWYVPLLEPTTLAFVSDRGARLSAWLRLRFGRGSQPHMLSLMTHPDDAEVAPVLVRFALRVFAQEAPRPVICQAREYEATTVDAVRAAGFTSIGAHALLVRHLTARLAWNSEVPAFDSRVVYGVKGFGTAPTRLSKGRKDTLCQKSSTTISTPCSPSSPITFGRRSSTLRNATPCSKSSSTSDGSPRDASPREKCF